MSNSTDSRGNGGLRLRAIAALLLALFASAGCVSVSSMQQRRIDELTAERITCDSPPEGFEPPNNQTVAAALNVLPGIGSFYLASGTAGRPSHYLWGVANFLLWPISIAWAAPEAYVDAGRINRLALVEFCGEDGAAAAKPAGVQERYEAWRRGRAPTDMIVSACADPQVKAVVDGIAVIPGEVYGYLAEGSDKAMARNAGREIYEAIMRDIRAGTPKDAILGAVSAEDLAAAVAYEKFVKAQDYVTLGEKLAGIATKLAEDGAKVAGAVARIKDLDSMKGKNPLALAAAMKEPVAEVNAIKNQLSDAVKAVGFWRDLNKQDEQMQKLAQEYPIEN